jgi:hypothetical protein
VTTVPVGEIVKKMTRMLLNKNEAQIGDNWPLTVNAIMEPDAASPDERPHIAILAG